MVAFPRLLVGQTLDDVDAVAERLRVAVGAHRCRVEANPAATACSIWWLFGDPLDQPFDATVPDAPPFASAVPAGSLDRLVMGRREDGQPWLLDLRVGVVGGGKASLIWSVLFGLGPAIRCGLVEVAGIDLKGGMELAMGRPLLTWYADTAEGAVALLEDRVAALRARTVRLAGTARLLAEPTTTEPLVLVVVD